MNYYVIAKKWSDVTNDQTDVIVGTFNEYMCARIFSNAYYERFKTECKIYDDVELLNTRKD